MYTIKRNSKGGFDLNRKTSWGEELVKTYSTRYGAEKAAKRRKILGEFTEQLQPLETLIQKNR